MLLAASVVTLVVVTVYWLASLVLSFVDDPPRWVEPYLALRTGPRRTDDLAATVSIYDPDPTGVAQTVQTASVRFMIGRRGQGVARNVAWTL